MNFDAAIVAHTSWKNKFKSYFEHNDISLDNDEIESDQKCTLGQWIYSEGQKWNSSASFAMLRTRHAEFHRAAANLLRKVAAGESVDEELCVGSRSEFSKCTADVVKALVQMREEAK